MRRCIIVGRFSDSTKSVLLIADEANDFICESHYIVGDFQTSSLTVCLNMERKFRQDT